MGKMELKTFDAADYLKTPEEIDMFLEYAQEDYDPAHMLKALAAAARARANMAQLARDAGLTRPGLYKALTEGANPTYDTVAKIAGALGYRLVFEKAASPNATGRQ